MKKLLLLVLSGVLAIGAFAAAAVAVTADQTAIYSKGSLYFDNSGRVYGDTIMESGTLGGSNNRWIYDGKLYYMQGADVSGAYDPNIPYLEAYSGQKQSYPLADVKPAPGAEYFVNVATDYKDGTKDFTVGWGGSDFKDGAVISSDSYIRNLTVNYGLHLNINVPEGQTRILRVGQLTNTGYITVTGGGRVLLYIDGKINSGSNGAHFNSSNGFGNPDNFIIVYGPGASADLNGIVKMSAHIFAAQSNMRLTNISFNGTISLGGRFEMSDSSRVNGYVLAPDSDTYLNRDGELEGRLVTKSANISNNAYVKTGSITSIPSGVLDAVTGGDSGSGGGSSDPGSGGTGSDDTSSGVEQGTVTIKATVARRMSIRLEDGRILKNGDSFTMPKYGTVKYQVCANNWDTDTYTDDGNGIAGPKVYEYTHQKNKENVLRVDNNRHFQYLRFHFNKGDYKKLTGIPGVVNTPLESLSVNLPLGATVHVTAHVGGQIVEEQDLFIDSTVFWHNWDR